MEHLGDNVVRPVGRSEKSRVSFMVDYDNGLAIVRQNPTTPPTAPPTYIRLRSVSSRIGGQGADAAASDERIAPRGLVTWERACAVISSLTRTAVRTESRR